MKKTKVKIVQKCSRCNHFMTGPVEGWMNCPNCGLSRFIGDKNASKSEEKTEESVSDPKAKTEETAPSPIEKIVEIEEVEAK